MKRKITHLSNLENKINEGFYNVNDCEVSKASKAIMLDRICKGKGLEFPFL